MRSLPGLFIVIFAGASSCQSNPQSSDAMTTDARVLMHNDFEQSIGWGEVGGTSLTSEKAHSGHWSIRASPEHPFSYTFARPLGELSLSPLQKMRLNAWALRTAAGSAAQVVVQVDASPTDETKVFYAALPLSAAVSKFGEWTAVSLPLTLPSTVTGTNNIKIYLWNDKSTTPTYLDDIELRRVD